MCMSRDEVCRVVDSLDFAKKVKTIFKTRVLPEFNSIESLINANQKQFNVTHRNICGNKCLELWDTVRSVALARKRQIKAEEVEAARKAEEEMAAKERTTFRVAEVKALATMMELCNMTEIDIVGIKEFFMCAKVDIGKFENK